MSEAENWQAIAPEVWSLNYRFKNLGLQVSTRMTVVRLQDGSLFAHSAIPLSDAQKQTLDALGPLRFVVAPNTMHHLFARKLMALYPQAQLYGPAGLLRKRPDLTQMQELPANSRSAPWGQELDCHIFGGIPMLEETVWFHPATGSLIATDILQCWQGPLSLPVRMYLGLTGGHERLTVPRTIRLLVRDQKAAQASAQVLRNWPVQRVILLHNSVIEDKAAQRLDEALSIWN